MLKLSNAERAILKELWKLIQSGNTLLPAQDDEPPQPLSLPSDSPPNDESPPNALDDIRRN